MVILYFIFSLIMASQATYPGSCSFWLRLLNFVLALGSFALAVGFAIQVLGLLSSDNIQLVMIFAAIPPICGIWLGVWADKQRATSKPGDSLSESVETD